MEIYDPLALVWFGTERDKVSATRKALILSVQDEPKRRARHAERTYVLSLLYVSLVAVAPAQWRATLSDIQTVSTARNAPLDITGLLIATPIWFAQLLEGPPKNVDAVMKSILADTRHRDVRIVAREMTDGRRCQLWQLAHWEEGIFEAKYVRPALEKAHGGAGDDALRPLKRLIDQILLGGPDMRWAR